MIRLASVSGYTTDDQEVAGVCMAPQIAAPRLAELTEKGKWLVA